jgi:phage terminase large subunit-like protein
MIEDPLLYLGLDIGIRRDSTALSAVYRDFTEEKYFKMWGCRIWTPTIGNPVNMVTQVQPVLLKLLQEQRIAALAYDPYQMETTQQWLTEKGFSDVLVPINQQTEMTRAANTLHSQCVEKTFLMFKDPTLRSHFHSMVAQHTERGYRIIKQKQSKPIDAGIATAMAVTAATGETGHIHHPTLSTNHSRSAVMLP